MERNCPGDRRTWHKKKHREGLPKKAGKSGLEESGPDERQPLPFGQKKGKNTVVERDPKGPSEQPKAERENKGAQKKDHPGKKGVLDLRRDPLMTLDNKNRMMKKRKESEKRSVKKGRRISGPVFQRGREVAVDKKTR